MEELKRIITEHWSTIAEYAALMVSYFLVFLYRNVVDKTKTNLTVSFKEKMTAINTLELKLREDVEAKLKESKENYAAAVSMIEGLKETVARQEKAINILIGDCDEENGTDTENESADG